MDKNNIAKETKEIIKSSKGEPKPKKPRKDKKCSSQTSKVEMTPKVEITPKVEVLKNQVIHLSQYQQEVQSAVQSIAPAAQILTSAGIINQSVPPNYYFSMEPQQPNQDFINVASGSGSVNCTITSQQVQEEPNQEHSNTIKEPAMNIQNIGYNITNQQQQQNQELQNTASFDWNMNDLDASRPLTPGINQNTEEEDFLQINVTSPIPESPIRETDQVREKRIRMKQLERKYLKAFRIKREKKLSRYYHKFDREEKRLRDQMMQIKKQIDEL